MAEAVERRKRYREQVRDEIKQVALGQIARDGAAALTLTGVAKEIGVSGPALYKYFAGRDDLLTELIVDSYASLADALDAAGSASAEAPARERLHAVARAYRAWAVAQPHRYLLLAGTPVPRYDAPAETVDRARAVLAPLLEILAAGRSWPRAEPLRAELAEWIAEVPAVADWVRDALGPAATTAPDVALAGVVTAWVRLHGVVSIEAVGLFNGMGLRPATVLALEMDALADAVGLD
ncbi:TetR/AcrR family transcriptional regulator [Jiangella endophytica]|uniref:TetR/AcrR family transcriptional regulator n=1 Tax=Jiangella endophytica TaxID=1623398 RepID=UPI000E350566|nr:TetR/AcrR family transcriptional regulator [Jiangella endophytica]